MRKLFMMIVAAMLCLSMAACSETKQEENKKPTEETSAHDHEHDHAELPTGTDAVKDKLEEIEQNAKPTEDQTIVGTWKGSTSTLVFNANGTGEIVVDGGSSKIFYTAKDGVLTIKVGENSSESKYTIADGKMKLIGSGSADTYTLVK